jgi:hypothetical protein
MVWEIIIACHLLVPLIGLLYLAALRERQKTQLLLKEALIRIANINGISKW